MTKDEKESITKQAAAIGDYYRAEAAKTSKAPIPRPAILDEQPPTDPARLPGWRALRAETDDLYTESLMKKSTWSQAEKDHIGKKIAQALRESGHR